MFKTISGSAQLNSGENTKINKQSHLKFWLNWIKYGAVSYSLSCIIMLKTLHNSQSRLLLEFFKNSDWRNQMALECIPNTAHKSSQLCLLSLLIYTLISEKQDLEKSRSILNPRKISDSANLEFFSFIVSTKLFSWWRTGKNQCLQTWMFSRV